jgi:hypothetical protein
MKNSLIKQYIAIFYLCSTFVTFAQSPGSDTPGGGLEGTDAPAAPIDDYLWVLALVGLVLVFMKLKAIQNKRMHS